MNKYHVDLEIFSGPMDLLLYLVRKDEVDIYDISIAGITEQYIKYVEMLKMFDIELAGDFLIMAATLMEIKSLMLLPQAEEQEQGEEDAIDPRTDLIKQLLEYKKFKDAANLLNHAAEERRQRFSRPNTILKQIKPDEEPELDLDEVSIWTLLETFDEILKSIGNDPGRRYQHITDDMSIDMYQIELLHRLQSDGPMSMQKIFEGQPNKVVMIGLFLGMLELLRHQLVWAEQPEPDGDIFIKPLTSEPAEQAVHNAVYRRNQQEEQDAIEQTARKEEPLPLFDQTATTPIEEEQDEPDDELSAMLADINTGDAQINTQANTPEDPADKIVNSLKEQTACDPKTNTDSNKIPIVNIEPTPSTLISKKANTV